MEETVRLAEFTTGLRADDVPADVRKYARLLLLDVLGAGLYGRTTEAGRIAYEVAQRDCRGGDAPVWGRPASLDARGAALVNGTQAHAYELDDYHPGGKLHPSAVVVPAALAVAAGRDVAGAELLTALVAGYEMMVRVSLAANAGATRERGWHLTGLVGPFGAATAAGRLLGLSPTELAQALGIAASCAGGLFAFSREGAMTKPFHAGRGAESGVLAAQLAADGFTGPRDVLEAEDGGFLRAVSDAGHPDRLVAGLGDAFEISNVAIKPYSCCGSIHASIDGVINLVDRHALHPEDIVEITAANAAVVGQQCGFTYGGTGGPLEAQMSLQYCLAVAALDRAVFLPQFQPARLADPEVLELARRVSFEVDPDLDARYPHAVAEKGAKVRIRTRGGRVLEELVRGPKGSTAAPCTEEDVEGKFRQLVEGVLEPSAGEQLLELVRDLEDLDRLDDLLSALRPASEAAPPSGAGSMSASATPR